MDNNNMLHLVVDIGNSFSKVAIFQDTKILKLDYLQDPDLSFFEEILCSYNIKRAIVSSVKSDSLYLENFLRAKGCDCKQFNTNLDVGITLQYRTPETLGLDRFAAVIGAKALFPDDNCLVIDAGTCVTYDLIDADSNYLGGNIAPGIKMRFQAMHNFTGKLPLLDPDFNLTNQFGDDTFSAMQVGVLSGITHESVGFSSYYSQLYPDLKILLCGGDVKFFDRQLKNSIFADRVQTEPYLVLIGLNHVLHHL